MGQNHRCPIPYLIHKSHRKKIHKQLYAKVKRHKQCDLRQRNVVASLKKQK